MTLHFIKLYSIKKRIKKEGETAELLCQLSDYYIGQNDFQASLEYAQKALDTDKDYEKSYCMIAVSLYKLGKIKELKDFCIKVKETKRIYVILLAFVANLLYEYSNYKLAYKFASMGIKACNTIYEFYRIKGFVLYQFDKYDMAGKYLLKAEELGCEQNNIFNKLAYIYSLEKDYRTSLKYADKAILINAKNAYSYYRKGCAHYKLNDYSKAKESFLKAEKLGYKTHNLYNNLSHIYFLEKEYKISLKYADKAISVNPNSDYSYYMKGFVYFNLKDYKEAKEAFLKAEELGCNYPDLFYKLSCIYRQQDEEDYKSSLQYADKAISANPNDGANYFNKAFTLFCMKNFSEAKDCFFKAEELGIRDEYMFYLFAYIFYMESDFEMALNYLDKAFKKNNKDRDFYESKAEILLKLGRKEEAEQYFQKAKQLDENQ